MNVRIPSLLYIELKLLVNNQKAVLHNSGDLQDRGGGGAAYGGEGVRSRRGGGRGHGDGGC